MTSRERVLQVFNHEIPDRVPRWLGASPGFLDKAKDHLRMSDEEFSTRIGDDFRRVLSQYAGPDYELNDDATWQSPFGVQRRGVGYGQPTTHPLAGVTDLNQIRAYPGRIPNGWISPAYVMKRKPMIVSTRY